jgi:hypothetical protein
MMSYDYPEFLQFYKTYLTPEFNTMDKFIAEITKNYQVLSDEAELMWRSFDIATDYCIKYGAIIKAVKEANE